jgi:type IV secretion system protein VirB9
MRVLAGLTLLCFAGSVAAQDTTADPRILSLSSASSGTLYVRTAPDVVQTLLFAPGTRITAVELSDPRAFYVVVSGTADSLTLRGATLGGTAIMTVRTSSRTYEFSLGAGQGDEAPRIIRLVPPMQNAQFSMPPPSGPGQGRIYKMSGERSLRPKSIRDDGRKTFIEWASDQAIPATFAIGPTGEEQMIDGYMRGGLYTLDRVYDELIFRIDRKKANARRLEGEKARG